jgi:hypothetical protein
MTDEQTNEMPERWKQHFPTTPEEAAKWIPFTDWQSMAPTVICAARTRVEGAWAAYIRGVPGINHKHEVQSVLDHGTKLPEDIALCIFPRFEGVPYAY